MSIDETEYDQEALQRKLNGYKGAVVRKNADLEVYYTQTSWSSVRCEGNDAGKVNIYVQGSVDFVELQTSGRVRTKYEYEASALAVPTIKSEAGQAAAGQTADIPFGLNEKSANILVDLYQEVCAALAVKVTNLSARRDFDQDWRNHQVVHRKLQFPAGCAAHHEASPPVTKDNRPPNDSSQEWFKVTRATGNSPSIQVKVVRRHTLKSVGHVKSPISTQVIWSREYKREKREAPPPRTNANSRTQ